MKLEKRGMKERPVILYRPRPKATFTQTFCNLQCCKVTCVTLARVLCTALKTHGPQNCVLRHNYMKAKSINEYILGWNSHVARHVAGHCLYTGAVVTVILSSCPCKGRCLGPLSVPRWRENLGYKATTFIIHRVSSFGPRQITSTRRLSVPQPNSSFINQSPSGTPSIQSVNTDVAHH